MNKVRVILLTGFGFGLSPYFPGSLGAIWGVIILVISQHFLAKINSIIFVMVVAFIILSVMNFIWYEWAKKYWESSDPPQMILDEIIGLLFVYIFLPFVIPDFTEFTISIIIVGYLSFRTADIIKLFGARWVDRNMHNALGVVLDDVIGAVYAILCTGAIYHIIRS